MWPNVTKIEVTKLDFRLYVILKPPLLRIFNQALIFKIQAKYESAIDNALLMVTEQGRMKFTRPLYRDLGGWDKGEFYHFDEISILINSLRSFLRFLNYFRFRVNRKKFY